jgi:hypothetical protein
MIWAILVAVGVPLWLCAAGIGVLVLRNRSLRNREDNVPMRLRATPDGRWRRGHGLWVHDVLSFRASPAGWSESLLWVTDATADVATDAEKKKLHRLGDDPVIVSLAVDGGAVVEVAAKSEHLGPALGPYADKAATVGLNGGSGRTASAPA